MLFEISIKNGTEKPTFYHKIFFSKFHLRGIADNITLKEVWEEVEVKFRKKSLVIKFSDRQAFFLTKRKEHFSQIRR